MEKNNVLWQDTVKLPSKEALKKNIKVDILIIGGGLTGCLCGYYLKKQGYNPVIVEAKRIGMGITQRTTAVVSSQHDTPYYKLIKQIGFDKAKSYLDINLQAVANYKELSKQFNFDFEEKPSFMYSIDDYNALQEEIKAVNSLGFPAHLADINELPFKTLGGVCFDNQGQLNPLKFLKKITSDLEIYENTFITHLDHHYAYTDDFYIEADKIIIATHFPFINTHGNYFMKMYQKFSEVIAIKHQPLKGTYLDIKTGGFYFRTYQDYLLIGGNDTRVGKLNEPFKKLRNFISEYYPDEKEAYVWSNQDCITLDNIPYIGCYSKNLPYVYVATGFNFWGFTNSMVSAILLTDLIKGIKNPHLKTFSPNRCIFRKELFINMFNFTTGFINFKTKRCSHLGCSLNWNEKEQTWDCPCHGSRFTEDGQVIVNPAMKDLK